MSQGPPDSSTLEAPGRERQPEGVSEEAPRSYLLVFAQASSWLVPLVEGSELTIGRAESCQIQLPEHQVSREHACVRLSDGVAIVADLGSHNGTRLNGQLLSGPRAMVSGDVIEVGPSALAYHTRASSYIRLITAMAFINVDGRLHFRGINGQEGYLARDFVHDKIAYFVAGDAWEATALTLGACPDGVDACSLALPGTTGPVVIYPSAYSDHPSDSELASLIVHEADHGRFGSHSCNDYADTNEDGPYGTQIQYLARIAARGNPGLSVPMSMLDRDRAWSLGMNQLGAICNADAVKRLSEGPLMAYVRIKTAPPGGGGSWR